MPNKHRILHMVQIPLSKKLTTGYSIVLT